MKPWMMALARARRLVTQSFTTNTTWVAPLNVSTLVTVTGKGGTGSPSEPGISGYQETIITYLHRRDGGTEQTSSALPPVFDGSSPPSNYCDPTEPTPDSTIYSGTTTCHGFFSATSPGTPATTGPSTTGFGKTFPGGTGGAATPVTYSDVAVTGGASYSLVVPSGGSITISYYQ